VGALLHGLPGAAPGEAASRDIDGLAAVQGSIMRNYFRLLRAHEDMERRLRRPANGSGAAALEEIETARARLAHELHSGAGQALAGIKIHLELIGQTLGNPPEQVRSSLHRIGLLAQEALQQVRSISRRLYPPDWQRNGLAQALGQLWDLSGIAQRFDAELSLAPLPAEPPLHVRVLLYRVAQEAVANAIRHSGATRLRMALSGEGAVVRLAVEDNGKGFDAGAALARESASCGIGLRSMLGQVRLAGGELRIESDGSGTRILVCVPTGERT
jgi:signal transduction histidine kinase